MQLPFEAAAYAGGVVFGINHVESSSFEARSAKDGSLLWRFKKPIEFASTCAVTDSAVYAPNREGKLYSVDAGTGKMRWSAEIGGVPYSMPVVSSERIFVGSG